jgi:multiple sugar transport system substrate-binding protein
MTLTILGPDDPALQALEEACAAHPQLNARVKIIPWADYRNALLDALNSPATPYQAVCLPGHVWLPELTHAGHFFNLNDLTSEVEPSTLAAYDASGLVPSVKAECHYQSQWVMLPLFTDGHIVFYRSDLLELPEQIRPSDLGTYAKAMNLPSEMSPLALKAHASEILLDWLPYLWENGGDLFDEQLRPIFNSPAGVEALTYYVSLKKFAPTETHQFGNNELVASLTGGGVAAAVSWGGQAASIFDPQKNPFHAVMKTTSLANAWNATWGVCIPANQPKSQAVETLNHLMQLMDVDCDQNVTRIAGSPVRQSSYSAEQKEIYPWLASQQAMLENCKTLPLDPKVGSFLGILYAAVYNAFTGVETPQQALDKAAAEILAA